MKINLTLILALLSQTFFSTNDMKITDDLLGKWMVKEPGNEYIIQITEDSLFRMYSYDVSFEKVFSITEISNGEIKLVDQESNKVTKQKTQRRSEFEVLKEVEPEQSIKIMKYEINGDRLIFIDQKSGMKTKAISCRTGICDEEKDFFRGIGVKVGLPFMDKEVKGEKDISFIEGDLAIYIGKPNKRYSMNYGNEFRMWHSGTFIQLLDLPIKIDAIKRSEKSKALLFIDKEVEMVYLQPIFKQFIQIGLGEFYIGFSQSENSSLNFDPQYKRIDLSEIKSVDTNGTLGSWLKY